MKQNLTLFMRVADLIKSYERIIHDKKMEETYKRKPIYKKKANTDDYSKNKYDVLDKNHHITFNKYKYDICMKDKIQIQNILYKQPAPKFETAKEPMLITSYPLRHIARMDARGIVKNNFFVKNDKLVSKNKVMADKCARIESQEKSKNKVEVVESVKINRNILMGPFC
ncbi:hypothetical protein TCON_0780 [Astathelohania contejeani]|uniref:Uncharacterized protein n=1 Tax=Astathelohania contejeani TaxID=164912 RepID=A0ABQ7I0T9_9MICR|nr:hypothetical protein TCON_0780 [Thelohania contejeani]